MRFLRIGLVALIILIILIVFKSWFLPLSLSTGDWAYKFPQSITESSLYPLAWDSSFQNGLGGNTIFLLALNTYFNDTNKILFSYLNIPWIWIEKVVWFWPFLIVSIIGSFLLFKKLLIRDNIAALVSSLIFTTNTYSLMITGGGQMGVGMGYAMIPFVFLGFTSVLNAQDKRQMLGWSILSGMLFSLQLLFDLRIAYVSMLLIGIYYVCMLVRKKPIAFLTQTILYYGFVPGIVVLFLHFFWLVPFIIVGQNPLTTLGSTFTDIGIVKFLSFANFENTISLLHPNWPDNLFGKAYFMRPEFLLLPILAYSTLLFPNDTKKRQILALSIIGIIGAFLAKGAEQPFGEVYIWLFQHFPGFIMFRDSTKWYGFVALSYSLLIPYFLIKASDFRFKVLGFKKAIRISKYVLFAAFVIFWGITIRQAITGQLRGTFAPHASPPEYAQLAHFISSQPDFFRTLWLPGLHQYSFSSLTHPAIPGDDFLSVYSNKSTLKSLMQDTTNIRLDNSAIKYIIVPSDTEGKLFTTDRKYSRKKYNELVVGIMHDPNLVLTKKFGNIVVFENPGFKNHARVIGDGRVNMTQISPVEYKLHIKNAKKSDLLIFSENFDRQWQLKVGNQVISSSVYKKINSFVLPKGSYTATMYYAPQKLVDKTILVSVIALFACIILVIKLLVIDK